MNDIQQWRRMIQPTRARTPAVERDDSDGVPSPTTPKRGLKPKLSSYFTHQSPGRAVRNEPSFGSLDDVLFTPKQPIWAHDPPFTPKQPAWAHDQPFPDPQADRLIDSIMCRLMSDPYGTLDPRFNGILMHIFEAYRGLQDDKSQLQFQADTEVRGRQVLVQRLQDAQKQWSEERQEYKAEIKRLELLLAQGKRGLAEVTLARQDSRLRQNQSIRRSQQAPEGLQTIFDTMDRNKRYEDKAYSSQRAVFRSRRPSPSAQMRRLSQQLIASDSPTKGTLDLPFGTPPSVTPSTLAEASQLEARSSTIDTKRTASRLHPESEPKTSLSDDTFSSFSCIGDLLPDEANRKAIDGKSEHDDELAAVKRIAVVLARRRNVDTSTIMPKLLDLFDVPTHDAGRPDSGLETIEHQALQTPRSLLKVKSTTALQKQPSLMAKASGFFQRLKPQLTIDTAASAGRRFSFDTGEESLTVSPAGPTQSLTTNDEQRVLRRSVSMSSLMAMAQRTNFLEQRLSPVPQSPTTSAPLSEVRRTSKIPTPVYNTFSIARPRQEREGSASSLLTAFKQTESARTSDSTGTTQCSPPFSRAESVARPPRLSSAEHASSTTMPTTQLIDRVNRPYGNAFAAAAARAACTAGHIENDGETRGTINFSRTRTWVGDDIPSTLRMKSDMSETNKENLQPMGTVNDLVDDGQYASPYLQSSPDCGLG